MVGAVRFELTTFCTPSRRAYQATLRPDLIAQACAECIIGRERPNSTSFPVRFRGRFQGARHRDTATGVRLRLKAKLRRVAGSARVEPGLAKVAQAAQPAVSRVANPRASEPNWTLVGLPDARRLAVGETADRAVCATRTTGLGRGGKKSMRCIR